MTYFERVAAQTLLAAVILSNPACDSDDEDKVSPAKADGQRKSDAAAPDDAKTVKWGVGVYDFNDPDMPVEGLKACVYPALKVCETTDQDGHAFLTVPADADVGVLIDGSSRDYIKLLVTFGSPGENTDENAFILPTADRAAQLSAAAGYTFDPKKGTVTLQGLDAEWNGFDGVTATLEPSAGIGPIYYGSDGPDQSLTATSADGGGRAVFGLVPPGDYTVTFSGRKCAVGMTGWEGEEENVARVPVVAGVRTLTVAQCE
jgi:hypothetical protein